ncbi:hypothetical protein LSAT2_023710 [Lamellibrachia satsuma]|nr:hypothetical protein LSAT2_023710 [Lamellibrachia satsuma]
MPLSDASSAPLAGDAKPGILRVCDLKGTSVVSNRGPSDSVKTWLVLVCVVGCAIQTATIVQLKRRIEEQEERVSTIEHVLSITGSPHAGYAQASATQVGMIKDCQHP